MDEHNDSLQQIKTPQLYYAPAEQEDKTFITGYDKRKKSQK